jgi:hypothetical protein
MKNSQRIREIYFSGGRNEKTTPCPGVSKFFYNRRYFLNFRRYLKN